MNTGSSSRKTWLVAAIALVMLVVSILIAMLIFLRGRQPDEVVLIPVKTVSPSSLSMTGFSRVRGTEFLVASVNESASSSSTNIVRESYSDGSARNLVFLNTQTLESRTLYHSSQQVILSTRQFPEPPEPNLTPATTPAQLVEELPVRCFVFQTARADGNKDGRVDYEDPFVIALTDAGGAGYQELLTDVTNVYWMRMSSDLDLLVIYEKNGVKQVSRINIDSRTLIDTKPLVDLGGEVK